VFIGVRLSPKKDADIIEALKRVEKGMLSETVRQAIRAFFFRREPQPRLLLLRPPVATIRPERSPEENLDGFLSSLEK